MSAIRQDARAGLHFPPDVEWMRTPLRDKALNFIYKTALDLAGNQLKSADVTVEYVFGEEDSETMDLTMAIDADWEFIRGLRHDILVKVGEWSREWSEDEQEDYGRRIYFSLIPSSL